MTGRADYWDEGGWNTVCYECGRKRKAGTLKRHWQGYFVCPEHWEPRQVQDFVRSVPDVQTPPWVQPASDIFGLTCSTEGSSAWPGLAMPGCMIPGQTYMIPWDSGPSAATYAPYSFCPIGGGIAIANTAAADCATVGKTV